MVTMLAASAAAQNPYAVPAPVPNPPAVPPPPTYVGPPGPAIPIYKSGGRIVGHDGYYPYDTGLYLLAETGVSRQMGWFTMVYPGGNAPAVEAYPAMPAGRGHHLFKHFRR
jgi:hypothetical protein